MLSFTFFTVLPSLLWSVSPFLPPPLYISVLSQWVNCFIIYLLYINFEGLLLVVASIFVVFLFSNSTLLHNNTVGLVLCCIKMQFFSLCFVCFISDYVSISLCCSPPACPSLSILHVRSVFLNQRIVWYLLLLSSYGPSRRSAPLPLVEVLSSLFSAPVCFLWRL